MPCTVAEAARNVVDVSDVVALADALAALKARRAGIQLGMMFVDEPPFLDGEGTDAYCDALGVFDAPAQRSLGMG